MLQLLCCPCGGQLQITPQPYQTAWQCPHCGAVCYAAAVAPDAPPLSESPLAPPVVSPALSQIVLPPAAARQEPSFETLRTGGFSPAMGGVASTYRRRSKDYYYVGAALISLLILAAVVSLNRPIASATSANTPRKTASVGTKSPSAAMPTVRTKIEPTPDNQPEASHSSGTTDAPEPVVSLPDSPPAAGMPSQETTTPINAVPIPGRLAELVLAHCAECHAATKQEAGLRMDDLLQRPLEEQTALRWQRVLQRLKSEEMPPKDASHLSREDRAHWIDWLQSELLALSERGTRPTIRRLNRAEYINTLQALTGLPIDPAVTVEDVVSSGFDTDAAELSLSPQIMRQYVQAARVIAIELRRRNSKLPGMQMPLFGNADSLRGETLIAEEARRRLQPFATAAFRRPVEEDKLARLTQIVVEKVTAGKSFDDGIQLAVQTVLCSPQFLLLTDLNDVKDDYALAAKLSYFLWSGPPDSTLLDLAEKQELRAGDRLREQVARMIKDPRSRSLADNFGGQWLGTRELGVMQPDEEIFPGYTPLVEASFREETHLFFDYVLRKNLSITSFIDADFTFVNEPLAHLYGIPNVRGNEFRKVSLAPTQHRGGVLTQATMLSITSDGVRSSPVIRGVWILENILGDPPSPPPADVPDLESDTRGTKTIREELARHRHIESCNSCHRKIDPLGFALENYDAIGQWRTRYRTAEAPFDGGPVDNTGELTDGTIMIGIAQLKTVLLQRKRDFARCLTEKLLAYGCSRKLDFRDQATVEEIAKAMEAGEYRFQSLIQAIVQSPAFRGS